jgi:hypothetical protein
VQPERLYSAQDPDWAPPPQPADQGNWDKILRRDRELDGHAGLCAVTERIIQATATLCSKMVGHTTEKPRRASFGLGLVERNALSRYMQLTVTLMDSFWCLVSCTTIVRG